jgi:hypothetical protein
VQPALDELFRDGTAMTHGVGFGIYDLKLKITQIIGLTE